MRTDRELQDDVLKELEWDAGVDAARIGVSVNNGVAALHGTVHTYREKATAERVVRRVFGIRAVANDLTVSLDGARPRTDSEIAEAVANALAWDSAVPMNAIAVTVADGWVTLRGEVGWQYQKSAAQIDAERMFGVKGVENLVTLKPRPQVDPVAVKGAIQQAFRRNAEVDSSQVKVETANGTVILTGTVKSLMERDEAERAAWSAPGVTAVQDRIQISPF